MIAVPGQEEAWWEGLDRSGGWGNKSPFLWFKCNLGNGDSKPLSTSFTREESLSPTPSHPLSSFCLVGFISTLSPSNISLVVCSLKLSILAPELTYQDLGEG